MPALLVHGLQSCSFTMYVTASQQAVGSLGTVLKASAL